jgi:predicted flavoprotein YhiN
VRLSLTDRHGNSESKMGEFIVSEYGVEGSLIYALSAPLRELILHSPDNAQLVLDWLPHSSADEIASKLGQTRKGMSFSNALRTKLNLPAICAALLRECGATPSLNDLDAVAKLLKAMPLPLATATRPIDEVISCAGGVAFSAVNENLMLKALPGVFVAGEMLDWEAPTGGYLLTACFATGKRAGDGAVAWVEGGGL